MKVVMDVKEANNLLQSYIGAMFQIAFYSESLKRIAIRIQIHNLNEVVYLIGIGCEHIRGDFHIPSINLSVMVTTSKENKENITRIFDKSSSFELITTGGFSLAQGYEWEFGTSFDNFIIEKE